MVSRSREVRQTQWGICSWTSVALAAQKSLKHRMREASGSKRGFGETAGDLNPPNRCTSLAIPVLKSRGESKRRRDDLFGDLAIVKLVWRCTRLVQTNVRCRFDGIPFALLRTSRAMSNSKKIRLAFVTVLLAGSIVALWASAWTAAAAAAAAFDYGTFLKGVRAPPDFKIELAAGEPTIRFPMFACFDDEG